MSIKLTDNKSRGASVQESRPPAVHDDPRAVNHPVVMGLNWTATFVARVTEGSLEPCQSHHNGPWGATALFEVSCALLLWWNTHSYTEQTHIALADFGDVCVFVAVVSFPLRYAETNSWTFLDKNAESSSRKQDCFLTFCKGFPKCCYSFKKLVTIIKFHYSSNFLKQLDTIVFIIRVLT